MKRNKTAPALAAAHVEGCLLINDMRESWLANSH